MSYINDKGYMVPEVVSNKENLSYIFKIIEAKEKWKIRMFENKGTYVGESHGFPKSDNTHKTTLYGVISNYRKGAEKVKDNGITWVSFVAYYFPSSGSNPSFYQVIYVKENDLEEIFEFLKSEKYIIEI